MREENLASLALRSNGSYLPSGSRLRLQPPEFIFGSLFAFVIGNSLRRQTGIGPNQALNLKYLGDDQLARNLGPSAAAVSRPLGAGTWFPQKSCRSFRGRRRDALLSAFLDNAAGAGEPIGIRSGDSARTGISAKGGKVFLSVQLAFPELFHRDGDFQERVAAASDKTIEQKEAGPFRARQRLRRLDWQRCHHAPRS
jgi:hypothetical protein